jgi:hypothetical protein
MLFVGIDILAQLEDAALQPEGLKESSRWSEPRADHRERENGSCTPQGCETLRNG